MSDNKASASVVDQAFESLFSQIDLFCDDIKMQGAEASLEGDFVSVKRIGERHGELIAYRKKLEKMQSQWSKILSGRQKKTASPIKKNGKLRVILQDEIIELSNNCDTFTTALSKIGLEQIALLDKKIDKIPLLEMKIDKDLDPLSEQGWTIHTDFDDATKYKILKDISKKLSVPLIVDLA